MNYRQLGKTDLYVSEISLGCSGFWGNRYFSEKKASALIYRAFERGINFFDTGHNYSSFNAEPRLGRVIRELLRKNSRSKIIISTKAGTIIPSTPIILKSKISTDFSADYIEKTCLKSIRNLNCEYLDIFQLHGINKNQITKSLLAKLLKMKERGFFRYLGINSHQEDVLDFISLNPELFDMVLLDYNVLQLDREPIISKLYNSGIGVVAGTVLAQGHLIKGKIGQIKSLADLWYLARAFLKPSSRVLYKNSFKMRKTLSTFPGISAAQAAFVYILSNMEISSCVFGTTNLSNLNEILNSVDLELDQQNRLDILNTFKSLKNKISL